MGFGADTHDKEISMLSGGRENQTLHWLVRCFKARYLMLGEPANHLDLKMLAWLESF